MLRLSVALLGALATWAVLAVSFDPFFVVGGTAPATIWGPPTPRWLVAAGSAVLLGGTLRARGRAGGAAGASVALWLVLLNAATHRLVERSDGRVADIWLGVALQRLPANGAVDTEGTRCAVGTWSAVCTSSDGQRLVTATPIPFAELIPGLWEERG